MYRPIGWKNPYPEHIHEHDDYEQGADAMLQGLSCEGSIRTKGDTPTVLIELPNIHNGTWVFIPDKE
jgi:hypothetical protein